MTKKIPFRILILAVVLLGVFLLGCNDLEVVDDGFVPENHSDDTTKQHDEVYDVTMGKGQHERSE